MPTPKLLAEYVSELPSGGKRRWFEWNTETINSFGLSTDEIKALTAGFSVARPEFTLKLIAAQA